MIFSKIACLQKQLNIISFSLMEQFTSFYIQIYYLVVSMSFLNIVRFCLLFLFLKLKNPVSLLVWIRFIHFFHIFQFLVSVLLFHLSWSTIPLVYTEYPEKFKNFLSDYSYLGRFAIFPKDSLSPMKRSHITTVSTKKNHFWIRLCPNSRNHHRGSIPYVLVRK